MIITIDGLAYNASNVFDYISTAIIGLYMLIAISHTIWILWYRVTSSSWDTVTELITLCQNSPPTQALNNTSAGIQRYATYTKRVKIRAVQLENGTSEQRICTLCDDDDLEAQTLHKLAKATLSTPLLSASRSTSTNSASVATQAQANVPSHPAYESVKVDKSYS